MSCYPNLSPALGCFALALALTACSSSKPMTSPPDGASADATADRASDPPADALAVADAPPPTADTATAKDAPGDPGPGKETGATPDVLSADLPPAKDVAAPDATDAGRALDAPDARPDAAADGGDASAAVDLSPDLAAVCTPGWDQTCNDNDLASALWGSCASNGTCVCKVNYVVNPGTGRCMPVPRDAATSSDGAAAACTGEFTACGCGCCTGPTPTPVCYYPDLGETTDTFRAKDEEVRQSTNCEMAGCSIGRRYACCTAGAPEPTASASYTADGNSGGLDHVTVVKTGTDCASLHLARPSGVIADDRIALQTTGGWHVVAATFGACADGGPTQSARGLLGTATLRQNGEACVIDVHASFFAFSATGAVETTRMDADGIPIASGTGTLFCR